MKRILLPAFLLVVISLPVDAQWVSAGPPAGAVNVIRSSGDRVYLAGDEGLFVSSDRGVTWTRLFSVPQLALTQFVIDPRDPRTLYVVASQHPSYFGLLFTRTRLFKSIDAGLSWRELTNGLPVEHSVASIAIDPDNSSTLYLGLQCGVQYFSERTIACDRCTQVTGGAGVYKSIDGGESWFTSTTGLDGEDLCVRGIAADPKSTGVLYAYSETLISTWMTKNSRSTDDGATWTAADPNSPSRDIVVHGSGRRFAIANPADCRGCTPRSAIVTSDDGETWRTITDPLTAGRLWVISAFAVDPRSDEIVYAATSDGLYVTSNRGAAWSRLAPVSEFRAARSVLIDPADPSVIYLATSSGLFVSRTAGMSWTFVDLPQQGASVTALVAAPGGALYGVLQDFDVPRTLVRSRDGGRSWELLGRLGSATNLAWWAGARPTIDAAADGTVYVLNGDGPQVIKRYDGREFVDLPFPRDSYPAALATDPLDANTLYVTAFPGDLWKSTDRGMTWKLLIHREGGEWSVSVAPTTPRTVYFGVGSFVLRSLDGGETWTESLHAGQTVDFAIPRDKPDTVYALICCTAGLFRSDDRGATWRQLSHPADARGVLVDPQDSNTVYLRYLSGPGVLRSTNGGATWAPFGLGLTSTVVNDLAADPQSGRIYAATFRRGVFALSEPVRRRVARPR